jgi:hypothetical protein
VRQVRWFVGDRLEGRDSTFTRKFAKADTSYVVSVDVRGDSDSRGVGSVTIDVGEPRKQPSSPSNPGGSGGGNGGNGNGGTTPTTPTAPYTPPSTPSTPPAVNPLPSPSTSPPANVPPSGGPNLDPSAPSTPSTAAGERVEGILVSANVPPAQVAQGRGGQPPKPANQRAAQKDAGVDWLLVGGIVLTALLVILGALRERVHIQRLLPATR